VPLIARIHKGNEHGAALARPGQARCVPLLAPVYDWFTEGFDTLDLKEAKALLVGGMRDVVLPEGANPLRGVAPDYYGYTLIRSGG
jgi:hypothetical protein